jgi:hypothetical protein
MRIRLCLIGSSIPKTVNIDLGGLVNTWLNGLGFETLTLSHYFMTKKESLFWTHLVKTLTLSHYFMTKKESLFWTHLVKIINKWRKMILWYDKLPEFPI